MDDSIEIKNTEDVDKALTELNGKSPKEITAIRGRLIAKIKKEIKKIKEKEDLSDDEKKSIEQLEERLRNLLHDHHTQIDDRYNKEFIKQKADLKSLITVLPKAVGLAAKKIATCISELQEAKTNKSRIFKALDVLKSIGMFVATPFIYTVKFAANHWYLVLLLLLLAKFPHLNKKPQNERVNQTQEDYATDEALEPNVEPVKSPVASPTVEELRREQLEQRRIMTEQKQPTINPVKNPVVAPSADDIRREQLEQRRLMNDQQVKNPNHVESPSVDELRREMHDIRESNQSQVDEMLDDFQFQKGTEGYDKFQETVSRFNERTNGRYYIRDFAENQDAKFYNTPADYLRAICEDRGESTNLYIDPQTNEVTKAGYEEIYRLTRNPMINDSRLSNIIYSDPEHKYLTKFQENGFCLDESGYIPMETREFKTVDDLIKALQSSDQVNNQLREDFSYCFNVSEIQDAINALKGLGITISAGSILPALTGEGLAIPIEQLATNPAAQTELIDIFFKAVKYAPELIPKIITASDSPLVYAIP